MVTRACWIAIVAACGGAAAREPIGNVAPVTRAVAIDPVVVPSPRGDANCALQGEAVDEIAPPVIALTPAVATDDCPSNFEATRLWGDDGCDGCQTGRTRDGRRVQLVLDGPHGSGHYFALALVLEGEPPRFACMMASTVGIRALGGLPASFAPLPWLADVDGDGASELVVWQRLPWGDAEVDNALFPFVYAIDGDRLVRRDDRARSLRRRVAALYAAQPGEHCFATVARALD